MGIYYRYSIIILLAGVWWTNANVQELSENEVDENFYGNVKKCKKDKQNYLDVSFAKKINPERCQTCIDCILIE